MLKDGWSPRSYILNEAKMITLLFRSYTSSSGSTFGDEATFLLTYPPSVFCPVVRCTSIVEAMTVHYLPMEDFMFSRDLLN
jgi:hypothetical protein